MRVFGQNIQRHTQALILTLNRRKEEYTYGGICTVSLDASKSSSIYGASSTVQPAAYYVHIWHRVA